jgi:16S rRNA (cytosine967-C5)-methyltransferase
MKSTGAKVRAVAAEVVDAVVKGGRSLDAVIRENEIRLPANERALMRMLCFGSVRQHWRLQSWIGQLIGKPLRKRDSVINSLLAIGLYQIVEMRIPDHAVVSETVQAARTLKRPKMAGLVNACLRRFTRDNLEASEPTGVEAQWNHPSWLIEAIQADWPDDWQAILSANDDRAPMWLRVNTSRGGRDNYLQRLRDVELQAEGIVAIPDAIQMREPQPVADLPGFMDGDASVQDAAAQIAARWLLQDIDTIEGKLRVLDACAAPGGKTGHLLEIGAEKVSVLALDNDESRLASIDENLVRIGHTATIICADASNPQEWWDGTPFDRILLDAPCSASGVIRRHPDIKLLRRESDIGRLKDLQLSLLKALWELLAPGGTILYATCSVISAENDEVVGSFLQEHDDAVENGLLLNNNIRDLMRRKACGYQVLPGTLGIDGFYYAALDKKKGS